MKVHKLGLVGLALLLAGLCAGCNKLKARDQLNKGVQSFQNAQFAQAVDHFQQAARLDPTLVNARLYLATAYEQEYVPGGASPVNVKIGNDAIDAFQNVLKLNPQNTDALGSIAQIYYEMKNLDKAKEYQQKLMKLDPNNPDPYYWIGVLDWVPCYKQQMELRQNLKLATPKNASDPLSLPPLPAKSRQYLAQQNSSLVDEGIQALQKAIELKPNYANAYSYLGLMYIQKSDLEPTREARESDLRTANQYSTKALALMKAGAQKPKASNAG